jgi:hypothetical protein
MRTITESNLLLRIRVELPEGLKLATEEFREGWNFSQSVDAHNLEKKILNRGWTFVKFGNRSLRSGVGETSQEAVCSALKLALRQIGTHSNAVEVEHIELTQYPWFFLARVRIHPYRIQQGAELPEPDEIEPLQAAPRRGRLPRQSEAQYPPDFASAMPQLKQWLVSP